MDIMAIVMLLIGIPIGAVIWALVRTVVFKEQSEKARIELEKAKKESEKVIKEAEKEAQRIINDGRKETERQKNGLLDEFKDREKRLNKREEQLSSRDEP